LFVVVDVALLFVVVRYLIVRSVTAFVVVVDCSVVVRCTFGTFVCCCWRLRCVIVFRYVVLPRCCFAHVWFVPLCCVCLRLHVVWLIL